MVTGTVLAATEFRGFLCARYDVTPHDLQKNVTDDIHPSPYILELAAATEALES